MAQVLLSLSGFRAKYPEFSTAPDPLVTLFLADAAERLDQGIWNLYLDKGHGLLTAHLLQIAPNGVFSRLDTDKAESTYGTAYRDLLCQVTSCIRTF